MIFLRDINTNSTVIVKGLIMRIFLAVLVCYSLNSCNSDKRNSLRAGIWRAELEVQDNRKLPFLFELTPDTTIRFINADEIIETREIDRKGDSITIHPSVFEGYIKAAVSENEWTGWFIKPSLNHKVPFTAVFGKKPRFKEVQKARIDITGSWETVFSPNCDTCRYEAKGVFTQKENKVTGTFLTTTGDYRFLEGVVTGDSLKLSTFDGAHAFLFEARVIDNDMHGTFYSGNHFKEEFRAKRNDSYELPDENTLTFLKEGYDSFAFRFPDKNGDTLSLHDPYFKDKVVIVQIMGSWCPNCLDETRFYTEFYNTQKTEEVAFVALAFEYAKTKEKAFRQLERLQNKLGVPYPILLAQYGTSDKKEAQKKLPMLNHVLSYPTTIFIDKKGKVRRIHTGFNGPATGEKHETFKKEFSRFVTDLSKE